MAVLNFFHGTPFAPVLAGLPISCLDIGCRDGIESDLWPIAFAVDAIGFEPNLDEFERLSRQAAEAPGPWHSLRYVHAALSGTGGRRTLSIPTDPQSATLLEPNASIGAHFDKPQFFNVERKIEVETMKLDQAMEDFAIASPDYLKIDVEGAEIEIFESGPRTLDQLLAIKTEVAFIPFRTNQPLANDIDRHLRQKGFIVMDFLGPAHWRRRGYTIHPQLARQQIPYSHGQLVHGDFLYFRAPETIARDDRSAIERLIKGALIAMAHGYFDHAEMILERRPVAESLRREFGIDVGEALHRTSLSFGRLMWRRALWRHLRLLGPFLRHAPNAMFPFRSLEPSRRTHH